MRLYLARDRLLRRLGMLTGTVAVVTAIFVVLRIPVPYRSSTALTLTALVAMGVLLVWLGRTGALLPGCAVQLIGLATTVLIVDIPTQRGAMVSEQSAVVAMLGAVVIGGVGCASDAISRIAHPRGVLTVMVFATAQVANIAVLAASGHGLWLAVIGVAIAWLCCVLIGGWITRALDRAAVRIAEVGDAHRAERLASEAEAQQRRNARILHDTVLATLSLLAHSGLGVNTEALRRQATLDAELLAQLRHGESIDDRALHDGTPDSDALDDTADALRQRFADKGLDVRWHGRPAVNLTHDQAEALRGAMSECLENVVRHAGVTSADVTVWAEDGTVRVIVSDSGIGFNPATVSSARLGFAESIVGRLHAVDGQVRVFSAPGAGTTVIMEVHPR